MKTFSGRAQVIANRASESGTTDVTTDRAMQIFIK